MSFKAMWNNRRVRVCSAPDCLSSRMSGSGIPTGMVLYHSLRIIRDRNRPPYSVCGVLVPHTKYLHPPEYDKLVTEAEADRLDRESGRLVPHGRNTSVFVMSRAARKRGLTTNDYRYKNQADRYSKIFMTVA